jgi:vancomycin permeability regulator SanA
VPAPAIAAERRAAGDLWFAVRALGAWIGALALLNVVAGLRHPGYDANLWWIDLRFLPLPLRHAAMGLVGGLLLAHALRPATGRRRLVSLAAVGATAAVALVNVVTYYRAWSAGSIHGTAPVPLSLLVLATLGLVLASLARPRPAPRSSRVLLHAAVSALVVLTVPLAQIAFFGTTDYRRPADAIVVFGAAVRPDGAPSIVLAERVARATELYREGLADTVVMSGGIEPNGFDETVVMRDLAVAQGVPSAAIVLDRQGVSTAASVDRTAEILGRRGLSTVLAVSQPYHLPRIKLAYARRGLDVWTVPAEITFVPGTGAIVGREIPAFWLYYLRATFA